MNWYKISSKNVEITEKMKNLAIEVSGAMMKYYGKDFNIEYLGKEIFLNPYDKQLQEIKVTALGKKSDFIAIYSPSNKMLNVYPNSLFTNADFNSIKEKFRQAIIHELVHAVDPSMRFLKIENQDKSNCDYLILYYEFNAYSRQICEDILFLTNQDNFEKQQVKKWLTQQDYPYTNSLKPYSYIIDCWKNNDKTKGTSFLRLFKKKVYDFIFNLGEEIQ